MLTFLSTGRIARFAAGHARLVLAGWLVGLVLLMAAAVTVGGELTDEDEFVGEPESVRGAQLLQDRIPGDQAASELVIVRSETLTVDAPAFQETVEATAAELRAMGPLVREAVTYYDATAAGDERAALLVSQDRRTTLIPVTLMGEDEAFVELVRAIGAAADGFEILTVGDVSFDIEESRLLEADLIRSEVVGLPVALVVLVVVFGALVAAGLPILVAVASILGAIGLTLLLGRHTEISVYALNMITMIGMAVGIDYSLFVIDRYREERRHGKEKLAAVEAAGDTASRAVLFSGGAVAIALMGMFLLPTTLFRGLAIGAIVVVAVAVLAALTLAPAAIGLLGDRLDWPRRGVRRQASGVRRSRGSGVRSQNESTQDPGLRTQAPRGYPGLRTQSVQGFSERFTRLVMARPLLSAGLAAGVLIAAALPFFQMERGTAGVESLPENGEIRRAYEILAADFPEGLVDPLAIVVDAERGPAIEAALDALAVELAGDDAFGAIVERRWDEAGTLAVVEVPLTVPANSPEAYAAIERLREELIPSAFAATAAAVYVAGDAAENADLNRLVDRWTPRVFALVLGLSFLLLLLAFRSVVVPLKAIAMNLLSTGAAYGLLVLVFQEGVGVDLLGFQQVPSIETWLPIFLFCILFGLSMDYHVFLLSRIKEQHDRTGDNRAAVASGLRSTARIITGAAAIMVVVFAAFASADLVFFQQLGFGLAVAIFLDATLVRSVLVPATMVLLGERNWYLPGWLGWLPHLRIEGGDRERATAAMALDPAATGD
jgi:putative drug exporter of the RND superfamily